MIPSLQTTEPCVFCDSSKNARGGVWSYHRFVCGECLRVIAICNGLWRYDQGTRDKMLPEIVNKMMGEN